MAALVAPKPRVHPASPRLKTGPAPRKAKHSLLKSVDRAYLGEGVCNQRVDCSNPASHLAT